MPQKASKTIEKSKFSLLVPTWCPIGRSKKLTKSLKNQHFYVLGRLGSSWARLYFLSGQEASKKSALGGLLGRNSRAGGGQGAPGGLRGRFLETCWLPKLCFVCLFSSVRGIVFFACGWTVFCSTFFLFEGCSRSARKRRTRRLYRKNQWF